MGPILWGVQIGETRCVKHHPKKKGDRRVRECWREVFGRVRERVNWGRDEKREKKCRDGVGVGESQSPINVFVG